MDLSIVVGNNKINVRVGVILKYQDEVMIELSKTSNSVIPGGRIKIGEASTDALAREIKEEMGFSLKKEKLIFKKVIENFFTWDNLLTHELFFVYDYDVNMEEYTHLLKIKNNNDNNNSYFEFIKLSDLDKINLLPKEVIELIKDTR